jgi:hypothetical protein
VFCAAQSQHLAPLASTSSMDGNSHRSPTNNKNNVSTMSLATIIRGVQTGNRFANLLRPLAPALVVDYEVSV